jgi:hypothetical protein
MRLAPADLVLTPHRPPTEWLGLNCGLFPAFLGSLRSGAIPPIAIPLSPIVGPLVRLNTSPLPKRKNNECGSRQKDDSANPLRHRGARLGRFAGLSHFA